MRGTKGKRRGHIRYLGWMDGMVELTNRPVDQRGRIVVGPEPKDKEGAAFHAPLGTGELLT
jgi:hypothetical protein